MNHKRARFAFCTSISEKKSQNVTPILKEISKKVKANSWEIFDQEFCKQLCTEEELISLANDKPYGFYKDIEMIWKDDFCNGNFSKENTLVIDSDDT